MERLKQRTDTADRALQTLEEVLKIENPSSIERDASIQRFEYSFESVWKLAKQFLRDMEGIDIGSPKGVIRSCREIGLFDEEETIKALEMVDHRNLTTHTYNEVIADAIYQQLSGYARLLRLWLDKIVERTNQQ